MDEDELIAVSPRHAVRLDPDYVAFVRRAPRQDLVVRTISSREANGMPLMSADIVIAGADVRERFPVAKEYPLHFRKTYYSGRLHGDPAHEFARQAEASALIGLPPPIGFSHDVFRSCLLPGTPYDRLSPFGVEPEEANLIRARELALATAAGLWRLAEEAFEQLVILHRAGLAHGDAELHNLIVSPSPLETLIIDFEAAMRRESTDSASWDKTVSADLVPLLREAVLLQCCLGQQPGAFAELAWERMASAFKHPERFRREIDRNTTRPA